MIKYIDEQQKFFHGLNEVQVNKTTITKDLSEKMSDSAVLTKKEGEVSYTLEHPYYSISVSDPLIGSRSVFTFKSGELFFTTPLADYFKLRVTIYVEEQKLAVMKDEERFRQSHIVTRLKDSAKSFEQMTFQQLITPTAVIIATGDRIEKCSSTVLKLLDLDGEQKEVSVNPLVTGEWTSVIFRVYDLSSKIVDALNRDMLNVFIANRHSLITAMSQIAVYDVFPSEVEMSELSAYETNLRSKLFDLSKDPNRTIRVDIQYNSIVDALHKYPVIQGLLSRAIITGTNIVSSGQELSNIEKLITTSNYESAFFDTRFKTGSIGLADKAQAKDFLKLILFLLDDSSSFTLADDGLVADTIGEVDIYNVSHILFRGVTKIKVKK